MSIKHQLMHIGRKELEYFSVAGGYGGNQNFMRDPWMHMGGCGALTACDSIIYMAKHLGMKHLYPFDAQQISKEEYVRFGMQMKPYLKPRFSGIDRTSIFVDGFREYLQDKKESQLSVTDLQGVEDVSVAAEYMIHQIDTGFPVPFLTLNHANPHYRDYVWHWYLINGYDYNGERLLVKATTYGHCRWLNFEELWDTGYEKKGGMILFKNNR